MPIPTFGLTRGNRLPIAMRPTPSSAGARRGTMRPARSTEPRPSSPIRTTPCRAPTKSTTRKTMASYAELVAACLPPRGSRAARRRSSTKIATAAVGSRNAMSARLTTAAGSRAYATPLTTNRAANMASRRESAWPAIRFHPFHQVLDEILEHRRVEFVLDLLSVSFGRDQTCLLEDAEVPRHSGPARVEPTGDLARGARRGA